MRGLGAFQMAQMKHRDARVFQLCQHLRSAIDVLEQIAADPYRPPEKPASEPDMVAPPTPPPQISAEKITYTLKEAAVALGVSKTTLWNAISDEKLAAIKLGRRTLIPAEALRQWVASLPPTQRRRRQATR